MCHVNESTLRSHVWADSVEGCKWNYENNYLEVRLKAFRAQPHFRKRVVSPLSPSTSKIVKSLASGLLALIVPWTCGMQACGLALRLV